MKGIAALLFPFNTAQGWMDSTFTSEFSNVEQDGRAIEHTRSCPLSVAPLAMHSKTNDMKRAWTLSSSNVLNRQCSQANERRAEEQKIHLDNEPQSVVLLKKENDCEMDLSVWLSCAEHPVRSDNWHSNQAFQMCHCSQMKNKKEATRDHNVHGSFIDGNDPLCDEYKDDIEPELTKQDNHSNDKNKWNDSLESIDNNGKEEEDEKKNNNNVSDNDDDCALNHTKEDIVNEFEVANKEKIITLSNSLDGIHSDWIDLEEKSPFSSSVSFVSSPLYLSPISSMESDSHDMEMESNFILQKTKTNNNTNLLRKNFQIKKSLGVGGFGKVVEAINVVDQSKYAMKIVPFSLNDQINDDSNGTECLREARSMAKMSSHPNVVRYFSAWTEEITEELSKLIKDIPLQNSHSNTSHTQITDDETTFEMQTNHGTVQLNDEKDNNCTEDSFTHTLSNRSLIHAAHSSIANLLSGMKRSNLSLSQSESNISLKSSGSTREHSHALIIQMEMCEHGTLKEWLGQRQEVDVCQSWNILFQIVQGLHHIHKCQILHRDIKPENVFMCANDVVKLGDFGLSVHSPSEKSACDHRSQDIATTPSSSGQLNLTTGLGTPTYAAPEQISGWGDIEQKENQMESNNYSKSVDIYPLGLIAYELFCNFKTTMERLLAFEQVKKTCVLDQRFKSQYPMQLSLLIEKMISQDPIQRPSTDEILCSLNDLYDELCHGNVHCKQDQIDPPSMSERGLLTDANKEGYENNDFLSCRIDLTDPNYMDEKNRGTPSSTLSQRNNNNLSYECTDTSSIVQMKNLQIDLLKNRLLKLELLLSQMTNGPTTHLQNIQAKKRENKNQT